MEPRRRRPPRAARSPAPPTRIDNVSTGDISIIEGDANLAARRRATPLNVFYVGFNVDMEPFNDPVLRQAVALGIDRQRLIDNFYPPGSQAATQFLPPGIPGYDDELRRLRVRPGGGRRDRRREATRTGSTST